MHEAWNDAKLDDVDPRRIGLIVGGSNTQQRELTLTHNAYAERTRFLRPTYAVSFMDSDLCGVFSGLLTNFNQLSGFKKSKFSAGVINVVYRSDSAGVSRIGPILITPDGKSCLYGYHRILSDLYLVEGLE